MTDTHTHLYLEDYPDGGVPAVEEAIKAGVRRLIFPNVDLSTLRPMISLHERFPEETRMAVGLHPTEVKEGWREMMARIEPALGLPGVVAVGEVGIDLYWDKTYKAEQMEALDYQIGLAIARDIPVIIHCREGLDEVLTVLSHREGNLPGILFHSFTGSVDDVRRIREVCDPMFGINGVVTFKSAKALRAALPEIGLDKILLETDSPYLTPTPHRGERNSSAYIPLIADMVARTLDLPVDTVEAITDRNALDFFKFLIPNS